MSERLIRVLMWLISLILCELCASVAERLQIIDADIEIVMTCLPNVQQASQICGNCSGYNTSEEVSLIKNSPPVRLD
ncbi:MAG: hypothetical protein AB1414_01410 [bacterium]